MAKKNTMELNLIINKDANQFVFALADKDFVDFLFDIPSQPVGSLFSLVQTDDDRAPVVTDSSLYNLCDTIKNFDDSRLTCSRPDRHYGYGQNIYNTNTYGYPEQPRTPKDILLHPITSNNVRFSGFDNVKATMYIVMDDLSVRPFSTASQNTSLEKLGYCASDLDNGKLDEIKVTVGNLEVMRLLKESLMTKNVLSTVFLGDKYNVGSDNNASGNHDDSVVLDQDHAIANRGPPPS